MSMFLRCTLRGNNLFVEMKRFLLTPVAQQYRTVDKIGSPTVTTRITWFIGSMIVGPFYVLYAVFFLFGRVTQKIVNMFGAEDRKVRQEIRNNLLFNYGAEKSLRPTFIISQFQHYFQKLDTDFYRQRSPPLAARRGRSRLRSCQVWTALNSSRRSRSCIRLSGLCRFRLWPKRRLRQTCHAFRLKLPATSLITTKWVASSKILRTN